MTEIEVNIYSIAYRDCKEVSDSIDVNEEFGKTNTILFYMDEILEALKIASELQEIGTAEEFKALRNASELWEHNNNLAYKQGRIDAIDEFVKEIEAEYDNDGCPNVSDYLDYKISIRDLQKIAEQLKGGATDE